ncbi:MAG: hypothetical protein ABI239_06795 [Aquihabitans sp.]
MDSTNALPASPVDLHVLEETERWFLRRGIPHFIEDYRADEDVFTRAAPILMLVFLAEVAGAINLDWRWWQNLAAVVGGMIVAFGSWAMANRLRHRRPLQAPDQVGWWELSVFVLVPPLLPLLFGGQVGAAAITLLGNLVVLAVIYVVTSYGLIPMTRWALGRTIQQLGAVLGLFGRAMPLLLLFSVALFINAELWAVAGALDRALLVVTGGFFVLLGLGFLLLRLPGEVQSIDHDLTSDELVDACARSPLAEAVTTADLSDLSAVDTTLSRRQSGNVLLVLLFSQAVQVVLVTMAIGAFFFVFGLLAIRPEVVATWVGGVGTPEALTSWTWFDREFVVTVPLVHVSVLIAVLGGFYFTVYVITDATYRQEFFTEVVGEVRQSLAVRKVYLALRAGSGAER